MTRPARVVIDIAALHHNLSRVRKFAPAAKVMAIVKADAYGHGLERVATALSSADAFGVSCLEEAEQLRTAGIRQPVVLLEGPYSGDELVHIHSLGLDIVVHQMYQLEMLEKVPLPTPLNVWLKVDSGMHRLGFDPDSVETVWQRLSECKSVADPVRLMTHFSCANEPDNPLTLRQVERFNKVCDGLNAERTMANSAAIIAWPDSHVEWVRPGLMLYGVSPMQGGVAADHELRPVMSLVSKLISIKSVRRGEPVGYGASWHCPEDMPVGIVAAGYGDGFPRHIQAGTPILVRGKQTVIIGNMSMDMLAVDLRNIPDSMVGDPVELWGSNLPVETIAKYAGTVAYELLCGVHKRLTFVENGKS